MLVYAIISLAVGVAMILGHNVWSGGALPVVVTLVGWSERRGRGPSLTSCSSTTDVRNAWA
jgi:hypothetical protein